MTSGKDTIAGVKRSASLQIKVADSLRKDLLGGALPPGTRLNESEIAKTFGCSRSTVRGAVHMLLHEGLIDLDATRGATARSMTRQDAEEIMSLRAVIDSFAAKLAAERITPAKAKELKRRLRKLLSLSGARTIAERIEADLDIHRYIVDCSEHDLLRQLYEPLENRVKLLLLNVSWIVFSTDELSKQHSTLIEAICSGDGPAAAAASLYHAEETRRIQTGSAQHARMEYLSRSRLSGSMGLRRERAPVTNREK